MIYVSTNPYAVWPIDNIQIIYIILVNVLLFVCLYTFKSDILFCNSMYGDEFNADNMNVYINALPILLSATLYILLLSIFLHTSNCTCMCAICITIFITWSCYIIEFDYTIGFYTIWRYYFKLQFHKILNFCMDIITPYSLYKIMIILLYSIDYNI